MAKLRRPSLEQVLAFCSDDPVKRVFLEDIARRGIGRFLALVNETDVEALCHFGANIVPAGRGCSAFSRSALDSRARMIIGDEAAVGDLWEAAREQFPAPRHDRARQPVLELRSMPQPGESGLRSALSTDLELLVPACARAHQEELDVDPLLRDRDGFVRRTQMQITSGRSWLWEEGGRILFKAEASAWTASAVQLQQVWTDPELRGQGYARRGLRDLCRLLLARVPSVCLFVRPENERALRLYEEVGMERIGYFRSIVF